VISPDLAMINGDLSRTGVDQAETTDQNTPLATNLATNGGDVGTKQDRYDTFAAFLAFKRVADG
jgi:hypothetical protein